MDKKFIAYLTELADKYSVASDLHVDLEDGAVKIRCNKGAFRFFYNFNTAFTDDEYKSVPLYHWQLKRRYMELRNILDNKMVETPRALRIHHIVPRDAFTVSLKDIIIFETNLMEFIIHQKIDRVFADFSNDVYANCIMSTDGNIKVSMELGFSPDGSEPVLLHEIVARTGIASDVVVDTQTQQYPIYLFKGKQTLRYNDIDAELYDIENVQADCIRFILWALADIGRIDELCENYVHLEKVYTAAVAANANLIYTTVEE